MLLNSFFYVLEKTSSEGSVRARLSVNKDHPILQGHFPGQPVVPGVCMMQLVKELTEMDAERKLTITEAQNVKFLSVMDPLQVKEIEARIDYHEEKENLSLQASLFSGPVVYFKLIATLRNAG
jgi:3-hydroxyacyl-[acyl-carrier-protein] dehydratase